MPQYNESVLGSSRYATTKELQQVKLLGNSEGIVLGKINEQLIEKPAEVQGHCLIVGGSGSGKSRGVAIPTLLRWKGSVFAIDIKGELSRETATHRNNNYIFDPAAGTGAYNPLDLCKKKVDAQEIASALIPYTGGDTYWVDSSRGILSAVLLEFALNKLTFIGALKKICTTKDEVLMQELMNSKYEDVRILAGIGNAPEKTLGGIMSQLRTNITKICDEEIDNVTSYSEWTPSTLEEGASIYLKINERTIETYKGLWSVIVNQILGFLMERQEKSKLPILLLLDELPRLGKIEGLLNALATLRSKNVHIVMCIQSMGQLDSIYGHDNTKIIADNSAYKLVLLATDPNTQKYFSDLAGNQTVWVGSRGLSEGASTSNSYGKSQHTTQLIRPEEFARLQQPILFSPGMFPCKLDKAYWDLTKDLAAIKGIGVKEEKKEKVKEISNKRNYKKIAIITAIILGILCIIGYFVFIFAEYKFLLYGHQKNPEVLSKIPIESQKQVLEVLNQKEFNTTVIRALSKYHYEQLVSSPGEVLMWFITMVFSTVLNLLFFIIPIWVIKKLFFSKRNDF